MEVPENYFRLKGTGSYVGWNNLFSPGETIQLELTSPQENFSSLEALGSVEDYGKRILSQLDMEFLSTRIGITREFTLISAQAAGGFYDYEIEGSSYAAPNSLGVSPEMREQALEWRRRFLVRVGVNMNGRVVKLSTSANFDKDNEASYKEVTQRVVESLRLEQ